MEGGVDTEERSPLDAAPDTTNPVAEETSEDNKFQKAIGAWRSMAALGCRRDGG
jgi:hypothetical protein